MPVLVQQEEQKANEPEKPAPVPSEAPVEDHQIEAQLLDERVQDNEDRGADPRKVPEEDEAEGDSHNTSGVNQSLYV